MHLHVVNKAFACIKYKTAASQRQYTVYVPCIAFKIKLEGTLNCIWLLIVLKFIQMQ
jgi:hypothetical protein